MASSSSSSSSSSSCVAEQHNKEGSQAFKSGDYDTAYRCYSRAIKAAPAVPRYWTSRANTLFRCEHSTLLGGGEESCFCDRHMSTLQL
jgi:hypothetical protein